MHPARVQASLRDVEEVTEHVGIGQPDQVFNVWHRKWAGGDRTNFRQRSKWKCDPEKDSGYTQSEETPIFCLYFARGMCTKGPKCSYLHRIPDPVLDHLVPATDCFGREKHAEYRDDFAGVGSFLHENSTLRVGYFKPGTSLESRIRSEFSKWGEIASVRKSHNVYFVIFRDEISAQFAKEAMANQTITGRETLTITWAAPEPHEKSKSEYRAMQFVKKALEDAGWHVDDAKTEAYPEIATPLAPHNHTLQNTPVSTVSDTENKNLGTDSSETEAHQEHAEDCRSVFEVSSAKKARLVDYSDSD